MNHFISICFKNFSEFTKRLTVKKYLESIIYSFEIWVAFYWQYSNLWMINPALYLLNFNFLRPFSPLDEKNSFQQPSCVTFQNFHLWNFLNHPCQNKNLCAITLTLQAKVQDSLYSFSMCHHLHIHHQLLLCRLIQRFLN